MLLHPPREEFLEPAGGDELQIANFVQLPRFFVDFMI